MFRDDRACGPTFRAAVCGRHPDLAFVVETDDGRVTGYIVAAPDTDAFERWFAESWWPSVRERYPPWGAGERERGIIAYAEGRGPAGAATRPSILRICTSTCFRNCKAGDSVAG